MKCGLPAFKGDFKKMSFFKGDAFVTTLTLLLLIFMEVILSGKQLALV